MQRHKKLVMGPFDKVPCPWCRRPNDCQDVWADALNALSGIDAQVDRIAKEDGLDVTSSNPHMDCDHCGRPIEIVKVDRRPRLVVRQKHR